MTEAFNGVQLALALDAEVARLLTAEHTGTDLFKQAVANVLQIPIDQVTPAQRNAAKVASFGTRFGRWLGGRRRS